MKIATLIRHRYVNENESVIFISKIENMGSQDLIANLSVDIFSEEQFIESIFLG